MKKIHSTLLTTIGAIVMIALTSFTCSNGDVSLVSGNYVFALSGANNWSPPTEFYTGFWVFTDGGFQRIDYPSQPPVNNSTTATLPSITIATNSGVGPLAFSILSNRKGDDNDKKKVSGGYDVPNNIPGNGHLKYDSYPIGQHNLSSNERLKIITDHGSNYALKYNELMLVITINNNPEFMTPDSTGAPSRYKLHLYHSNNAISYTVVAGIGAGNYPCGNNKYFAFAQQSSGAPSYGSLSTLGSWKIENNFPGHEKNVYCLLQIPELEGVVGTTDQFTALMTNNNGGIMQQTVYNYPVIIGNSLDPNFIDVDRPISNTCGAGEALEYIVHFENVGRVSENCVSINLHLDNAIDKNSVVVTEAAIGNSFSISSLPGAISKVSNCRFNLQSATRDPNNTSTASFQYSINPNVNSVNHTGTVTGDATFEFNSVDLKGTDDALSDIQRQGYVKFKVVTSQTFTSINNQAGIFFCEHNNPEIVTNLAETICLKGVADCDSCNQQLTTCHEQLKDCKNNSTGWMSILGWIIAGIELLLIFYLLSRKQK